MHLKSVEIQFPYSKKVIILQHYTHSYTNKAQRFYSRFIQCSGNKREEHFEVGNKALTFNQKF